MARVSNSYGYNAERADGGSFGKPLTSNISKHTPLETLNIETVTEGEPYGISSNKINSEGELHDDTNTWMIVAEYSRV